MENKCSDSDGDKNQRKATEAVFTYPVLPKRFGMSWGPGRKHIEVAKESLMKGIFTKCENDNSPERVVTPGASNDGKQWEEGQL